MPDKMTYTCRHCGGVALRSRGHNNRYTCQNRGCGLKLTGVDVDRHLVRHGVTLGMKDSEAEWLVGHLASVGLTMPTRPPEFISISVKLNKLMRGQTSLPVEEPAEPRFDPHADPAPCGRCGTDIPPGVCICPLCGLRACGT